MSRLPVLVLAAALFTGCQHIQTRVALPGDAPAAGSVAADAIRVGDEVRIVLRDGTRAAAAVAEVRPDELVATSGRRYAYADMVQLEIRKVAAGRSAGLAAAIVVGTLALYTLMMLAAGWELDP